MPANMTPNQCRRNVGAASATLAQHHTDIGPSLRFGRTVSSPPRARTHFCTPPPSSVVYRRIVPQFVLFRLTTEVCSRIRAYASRESSPHTVRTDPSDTDTHTYTDRRIVPQRGLIQQKATENMVSADAA